MLQTLQVTGYTCDKLRLLSQKSLEDVELPMQCLPYPVVWSPLGPVPIVGVPPERLIQSKSSFLSCCHIPQPCSKSASYHSVKLKQKE